MARESVDVQEVVHESGLQVTIDTIGLVSLVNVEDLHPTQVSGKEGASEGGRERAREQGRGWGERGGRITILLFPP